MQKTTPSSARVYLGSTRQESRSGWLDLCRTAISSIEGVLPLNRRHIYAGGNFDRFLKALRATEAAVLPCLRALSEREMLAPGERAGAVFQSRLLRLERQCLFVIDAEHNPALRSCDGAAWDEHVAATHRKITQGRTLSAEKAASMAADKKLEHPGIVEDFRSPARAKDADRVRVIWTSRSWANEKEALSAIGVEFPELSGLSRPTAERITGYGRLGKRSARATARRPT